MKLFYILEVHMSVKKAPKPRFSSSICSADPFKIAYIYSSESTFKQGFQWDSYIVNE